MSEVDLRIEGMRACIRRVTQSLQTTPDADVEEVRLGAARVKLADGASVALLIAALGKVGFAAQEERS